jgi:cobalt-zinc-cadmium efflux system membrane fusion protein
MKHFKLTLLVLPFAFIACTGNNSKASKENKIVPETVKEELVVLTDAQLKNADLQIGTLIDTSMHKVLKVNGHMDVPPNNIVSVSIPYGGYVKKTNLIPGTFVKKGSILAVLEDPAYVQLQQDFLTATSKLVYLEADYHRQKGLNETKAVSDKIFQAAKADYETQKYMVKALSEKLKLLGLNPAGLNENNISRSINFTSPINGYITKVNVNNGKYVSPTDILFEIVDPSDLHLRLTVLDNDALNLQVGNQVSFYTNNKPNEKYLANVAVITPNIGEESTTEVHCHLVNEQIKLFPGTFVNAEVALNFAKVKALPEEAIVKWQNKDYVFVKQSATNFKLVPVNTGMNVNGLVEIKSDLNNQQVVLKNAFTLLMKLKNNGDE